MAVMKQHLPGESSSTERNRFDSVSMFLSLGTTEREESAEAKDDQPNVSASWFTLANASGLNVKSHTGLQPPK